MGDLEWLKVKGNIAFKQEDYHRALDFYNSGLMTDPENYSLHCNMAQAYLRINDFCKAESHAVRAFQIKKDYVKAYYRAAKAAFGSGDTNKALHFIDRGIRFCANPADLHKLKAEITGISFDSETMEDKEDKQEGVPGTKNRSTSMPRTVIQTTKVNKRKGKSPSESQSYESEVSHQPSKIVADDIESMQVNDKNVSDNATTKVAATKSRSASEPRTAAQKQKVNKKQRKGPIESQDFKNDAFFQTLKTLSNEILPASANSPCQSANNTKEHLQTLVQEGSQLLEKGLPRKAAEKYKEAANILSDVDVQVYGWEEIEYSVLQYALCWSWIEGLNYEDIVSSINTLMTVKNVHGPRLPAVHYALGSAYSRLNRYKPALQHVRTGIEFLNKDIVFGVHPWPGTNNIIKETTRSGLQESLNKLFNVCAVYHQPDAVCRYKDCLSTYPHIIPSADIFYSDPDFSGLVVVICQEDCKIQYHLPCWKHFKETYSDIVKLSDKDMLGMQCPTADCMTSEKIPSVVIRIEIFGEDAELKSCCSKEIKKSDSIVKDTKKIRKKKEKLSTAIEKEPKRRTPKERKVSEQTAETIQFSSVKSVPEADELSPRLKRLEFLRERNFGYPPQDVWNPKESDYGKAKGCCIEKFKIPEFEEDSSETKGQKSFLYTYFVELLNSEGPIKLDYIIKKWGSADFQQDFQQVKTFLPQYDGIVNFLLASCQCAVVEDTICLAKDLPFAYNNSTTDLVDGLNFTLMDTSSLEDNGANNNNNFVDTRVTNENISNNNDKATIDIGSNSLDNNSFSKLENKNNLLPTSGIPIFTSPSREYALSVNDSYVQDTSNKTLINIGHKNESDYKNVIEIVPKLPDYLTVLKSEDHNCSSQASEESMVKEMNISDGKSGLKLTFERLCVPTDSEEFISDGKSGLKLTFERLCVPTDSEEFVIKESNDSDMQPNLKLPEQLCGPIDSQESIVKEMNVSDREASYKFIFDELQSSRIEEKLPLHNLENTTTNNIALQSCRESFLVAEQMHFKCGGREEHLSESKADDIPIQTEVRKMPCFDSESSALLENLKAEELMNQSVIVSSHYPPCAFDESQDWVDESASDIEVAIAPPPAEFSDEALLPEALTEQDNSVKTMDIKSLEVPLVITKPTSSAKTCVTSEERNLEEILKQTAGEPEKALSEQSNQSEDDTDKNILTEVTAKVQHISVYTADKSTQVDGEENVTQLKLEKLTEEISQKEKIIEEMKEKHHAELSQWKEKNSAERKAKDGMLELCKQMVNYVKYSEFKKLEIYKTKFLETKELLEIVGKKGCPNISEVKDCSETLKRLDKCLTSVEECDNKLKEWYTFQSQELNEGKIENFRFPTVLPEDIDFTHKTLIEVIEKLTESYSSNSNDEETNLEFESTIKTTWEAERSNTPNGKSELILDSKSSSPLSHKPYPQYHIPDLNSSTLHRSLATALMHDKSGRTLMDVDYDDQKLPNSIHTSDMSQLGAASLVTESNSAEVKPLLNKELAPLESLTIPYGGNTIPHQIKMQAPSELKDSSKSVPSGEGAPLQYGNTKGTEGKKPLLPTPLLDFYKKNEFTYNPVMGSVPGIPPYHSMQPMPVSYMPQLPMNYPHHMAVNYPQYMAMNHPYPQHTTTVTVPSVPPVTPHLKPRAAEFNIDNKKRGKLLNKLRTKFPFKKREEIEDVLSRIRREHGHLSGMRVSEICTLLEKEFNKSSKKPETGPMGMEKFGGSAWGDVKESVTWSKPQENEVDDCVICMEPLTGALETLTCNHDFHRKCIRRWFKENRICPLCQVHANVHEEFPPLS